MQPIWPLGRVLWGEARVPGKNPCGQDGRLLTTAPPCHLNVSFVVLFIYLLCQKMQQTVPMTCPVEIYLYVSVRGSFRKDLRRLYEILRLQLSDPRFQIRPPQFHFHLLSVESVQWEEEELVPETFWIRRCSFPRERPTKSCCSVKTSK